MVPECGIGALASDKWLCVNWLTGVTETTNTCSNSYQGLRMCRPYQQDRLDKEGPRAWLPCFVFAGETASVLDNRELKPQSRHCLFASLA